MAFRHHVFDGPLIRPRSQIRELRVIARLEVFVDQVGGRGIDALIRRDEIANAALAIRRLHTILPDHALATGATAAIDVGFVLVLRHVVARRHAHREARIGTPGIARAAHAIAVFHTGVAERTRIAGHTAAIDIRLVLILDPVITRRHGRTCFRHAVAIHRAAIAVLRTRLAQTACIALRSAAIDIRFVLILDPVATRRCSNTLGGIRIANIAGAIAVHRAAFANIASGTGPAATIDVSLRTILRAIVTSRCRFARLGCGIAQIAQAIAILTTNLADVAFVALRTAAIDIRFVLILRPVATRRHSRISTSNRRHAIVANFAIRCAIEQIDPLPTTIGIRGTALNAIAATLRRANGRTAVITRTSPATATTTFPTGTSATTLIRRSRGRCSPVAATKRRRAPEDQHE